VESSRTGGAMDAVTPYPLRALNIGEIFDRAITIYIRNIVPLTLIVMTFVVPLTIVQALVLPTQGIRETLRQIQDPRSVQPMTGTELGLLFLTGLAAVLLLPIVNSAVAVGVANIYSGKAPSYGRCFSTVLRHVWPLIGATLLYIGMLVGLYFVVVLAAAVLFGIGLALSQALLPLAILLYVLVAVVVLAFIGAAMVLAMGLAFATYATVIESRGAISAVSLSFRRIFSRTEIGKALLMALAYVALNIGIAMLSGTVAFLAELLLHNRVVDVSINAVVSAVSSAALTVLLAVYYYDVRTRSEGLDLDVELAELTSAP
jgi:hypothetical protein